MEYGLEVIKKYAFHLLVFLMLSGCGYFDNDGTRDSKSIVGNISVEEFEGTNDLVLKETDQTSAIVVPDCHLIYYDSIAKVLYVESPITEEISSYYRITLMDTSSRKIWEALKKESIDKNNFERGIKKKGSVKIKF
jgi:hypothetical protein